jgi:hypothetical protein
VAVVKALFCSGVVAFFAFVGFGADGAGLVVDCSQGGARHGGCVRW